ncbi:enoyl-CoA hydratase/isomerase family protein [Pseudomaricurvus alcaniphilus]|uniref:enoyl-CoA hydratase/isomerase family protein n=1 Tax=Pseudomaricurvus alcaniphilus TaxID=1166482 RepID=UPI0014091385|nr:enoyl-CoA hydratase/isomerase family protein [Pseudomaricurvus alcaniphilus]NHN39507.1 enoyl-CoA hydratase/isomerase family protein [Pseudomaricurvus alcaniphilus]
MSDYQTLNFEMSGSVAVITLNRPEAANGINLQMSVELSEVARRCECDPELRAVLLTGTGKLFCGGGDVHEMSTYSDAGLKLKELADALHRALISFANMRAPLIVAVNGTAAGAGFSLVTGADYAIAVDNAKFTMAYTKIGLSPDGGASYHLPRLVGARKAYELIVTNRVLSAQEALEWGLLNQVVGADELMDVAMGLANSMAAGSIDSNGSVKRLLKASFGNSLESQLELESNNISSNARSANGVEGVKAFTEKRAPVFK